MPLKLSLVSIKEEDRSPPSSRYEPDQNPLPTKDLRNSEVIIEKYFEHVISDKYLEHWQVKKTHFVISILRKGLSRSASGLNHMS